MTMRLETVTAGEAAESTGTSIRAFRYYDADADIPFGQRKRAPFSLKTF